MLKSKLLLAIGLLGVVAIATWYQLNWNREVAGKSLYQWHALREQAFETLRRELRPLAEITKGDRRYQAELVEQQAVRVYQAAQILPELFVAVAPSGDADAAIWQPESDFSERLQQFIIQTQALAENPPASAAEVRGVVDQIQSLCADCHRNYKQ